MSRFVPGNWRSSSAVIDAISRRADSSETSGFKRAKMRRLELLRLDVSLNRQVAARGLQVLADGRDLNAGAM